MDTLGLQTGFPNLDDLISGLMPGQLYIIASRPWMGKTSFAVNIFTNVTMTTGKTAVIISLELESERLVNYFLLPSMAHVSREDLHKGKLSAEDLRNVMTAKENIERRIFIEDSVYTTVSEIMAQCRSVEDLGLVVIDYLQLVYDACQSKEKKEQIFGEITQSLKTIAVKLNVPVILLSQVSRATEHRSDKHPLLTDLLHSDAIVHVSDVILALYRESYYNKECEDPNDTEVIVLKNRNGETGTVHLRFIPEYNSYLPSESKNK